MSKETQRQKRSKERDAELSRALPAPFEHRDGYWWKGVIDQYLQRLEKHNAKRQRSG